MSRFSSDSGGRAAPDIFSVLAGVAALVMLLGCVFLVFHNMEASSSSESADDGGVFSVLD